MSFSTFVKAYLFYTPQRNKSQPVIIPCIPVRHFISSLSPRHPWTRATESPPTTILSISVLRPALKPPLSWQPYRSFLYTPPSKSRWRPFLSLSTRPVR
ncbi:hypothetical protein TNCT_707511 [Trichonephila clavata]|uniref:Uncharacterized protein n=1 Tax=Trichonephila clavata TaxID=2740835 RepID=A0A8X6LFW2_TRICU|nr:hypothetical protein TNCT_707511 [Trichonephila clavata]